MGHNFQFSQSIHKKIHSTKNESKHCFKEEGCGAILSQDHATRTSQNVYRLLQSTYCTVVILAYLIYSEGDSASKTSEYNILISCYLALDAAQPGFEKFDEKVRLHHADAQYVDALHTNARPFFQSLGLGFIRPIGEGDT